MEKLDLKDRKILYHLDLNCRQSNAQIGRKVGLSKQVVDYRIKRMEDEGIITCFWTAINTFKLGYNVIKIYIKFRNVTPIIKKKMIEYFSSYKNIFALLSVKVPFDFDIIVWVKDINEFYRFWNEALQNFDEYFSEKLIVNQIHIVAFDKLFLIDSNLKTKRKKLYEIMASGNTINIDKIDYLLLNEIAVNARIPLINLSKKFDISSQSVKYRIDKMEKLGLIKAFRVYIDYSKIGFNHYGIEIFIKNHKKKNEIIEYIKRYPNLEYYHWNIGYCDLQTEFIVQNMEKLTLIVDDLTLKFSDDIRKIEYWITDQYHKERWLPEMGFK
jgi:Lrp/AsnC family leucine-responsive transcriptional regulator